MGSNQLYGFAIAAIAIGVAVWLLTDSAMIGLALVVVGLAVAAYAAFRGGDTKPRKQQDPDAARRRQRADEQREQGATDAEAENAEDRPPATGA